MKWVWASLAVVIFSTVAMGQQIKLDGRLINDDGKPVPNIRVSIADEQSAPTDKNGKFSIRLPSKLKEGERVVIILDADPLTNIRNTRKIWQVLHYGHVVDRPAILAADLRR